MGNDVSLLDWNKIKKNAKECQKCDVKDMYMRLGISMIEQNASSKLLNYIGGSDSDNNINNNNNNNNDISDDDSNDNNDDDGFGDFNGFDNNDFKITKINKNKKKKKKKKKKPHNRNDIFDDFDDFNDNFDDFNPDFDSFNFDTNNNSNKKSKKKSKKSKSKKSSTKVIKKKSKKDLKQKYNFYDDDDGKVNNNDNNNDIDSDLIKPKYNFDFDSNNESGNDDDNDSSGNKSNNYHRKRLKELKLTISKLSDDDIDTKLKKLGINHNKISNRIDKIECLLELGNVNFWRINANLHPNYKRIKNWLNDHKYYIKLIQECCDLCDKCDGMYDSEQKKEFDKIKKKFNDFDKRFNQHSEYEDTMLFKFLDENMKKYVPNLNLVKNQDKIISKLQSRIKDDFDSGYNNTTKRRFDKLLSELTEHLEFEEQVIAAVWLGMGQTKYKKYRTYLSWAWSPVY